MQSLRVLLIYQQISRRENLGAPPGMAGAGARPHFNRGPGELNQAALLATINQSLARMHQHAPAR